MHQSYYDTIQFFSMVETADELQTGWSGTKCPEYDGDDDKHQISVSQQITVLDGLPAIQLMGQCTCGWSEQTTITR